MKGSKRQNKHGFVINSPVGKLGAVLINGHIAKIEFLPATTSLVVPKSIIARRIIVKIKGCFCNPCC